MFYEVAFFMKYVMLFLVPVIINSQIVINELMPYPVSGSPEWIELYNTDSNNVFFTAELWIEDATSRLKIENVVIEPNEYLIITRDTHTLLKNIDLIPCRIIQAVLPTLNNSKDRIILRNKERKIIDSISYIFLKEHRGKSYERIYDSISNYTYLISNNPEGHTCGYINSVLPLDYDLHVYSKSIKIDSVIFILYNNGNKNLHQVEVNITNGASILQFKIDTLIGFQIKEVIIPINELNVSKGINQLSIASSHSFEDPRPYNNNWLFEYYQSFPKRSIIINEINIDNTIFPEYIELKINNNEINLQDGYSCIIGRDTIDVTLETNNEFILLTKDSNETISHFQCIYSSRLNIPNEGGIIKLIDPNGYIMDSIDYTSFLDQYSSYIHVSSLEFTDSLDGGSWFISMNEVGGTPGKENSPISSSLQKECTIEFENCISSFMNCQQIHIQQPFTIAVYSCDVYTMEGFFISSIFLDKFISTDNTFSISNSFDLNSSVYMLIHRIKNYQGVETITKITPFIKRN